MLPPRFTRSVDSFHSIQESKAHDQDITVGLEKVGSAAFNLIPKGLKDALNPEAHVDKGKQPMGSPPQARRSSVTGEPGSTSLAYKSC